LEWPTPIALEQDAYVADQRLSTIREVVVKAA
jgi:hypothetical protein